MRKLKEYVKLNPESDLSTQTNPKSTGRRFYNNNTAALSTSTHSELDDFYRP